MEVDMEKKRKLQRLLYFVAIVSLLGSVIFNLARWKTLWVISSLIGWAALIAALIVRRTTPKE